MPLSALHTISYYNSTTAKQNPEKETKKHFFQVALSHHIPNFVGSKETEYVAVTASWQF